MKPSIPRRASASLEAVLATAITLPIAFFLLRTGWRACRTVWQAVGALVGWPYL